MLIAGIALTAWLWVEFCWYAGHCLMHDESSWYHLEHHELYSAEDYLDKEYREPSKGSGWRQMMIYMLPVISTTGFFIIIGLGLEGLFLFLGAVAYGQCTNYVHDAFHLEGHWLTRFKRFRVLRDKHRLHHAGEVNFGIMFLFWDRVFRTYAK